MMTCLALTDLTRMQNRRVCIAGYDDDGACIRPVLPPPGIPESILTLHGQAVIYPFAVVRLNLLDPVPQPPHTEDVRFDPWSVEFVRPVRNRQILLDWSLYPSVAEIFEQPIRRDPGFYILDGQGPRSLGTIRPQQVVQAIYENGFEGAWDYRLVFCDADGETYRLKITDLTWHLYCDSLRGQGLEPAAIAAALTTLLSDRMVYVRIGLARGWSKYPERCYLQITGIHTFPDYLEGKTFADFQSERAAPAGCRQI